ncbi:acyl-CoA synthetase [Parafrigoribacterium mesophilum]|uniref:AMP-binding protein n=1 Tax=Parafrigoribacterium mesophilum TaxID=433646 RepID=UPI0031FD65DD
MDAHIGSLLESIADLVAEVEPGRIAIVQGARQRSWADFEARSSALAGHLAQCGVTAGACVGIGLYNSIEYFEALLATFKLGAVPININYRYRDRELEQVLTYTGTVAVVVDDTLRESMGRVATHIGLRAVVVVGGDARQVRDDPVSTDYEQALAATRLARRAHDPSDRVIMLTGGTTGTPKGVVWTHSGAGTVVLSTHRRMGLDIPVDHEQVVALARAQLSAGTAPTVLPASPLMHGTGFFSTIGNLLLAGRVVCLPGRSFDAAALWSEVERHRVDEIAIVGNAFAWPMVDALERAENSGAPYDISSLRRVVSSGMPWSVDAKEKFLAAGNMTLHDSISSTEGGPYAVSIVGTSDSPRDFGFRLPANARLIGSDGAIVEAGSGEAGLLASCGNLPLGYLDDPAMTAAVFREIDGVRFAVPGDVAAVAGDGTLVFLGRGAGVINTGGEKVFTEEVEAALVGHPDVQDAVVVGMPDERWGSRIIALVRLVDGRVATQEELSSYVGRTLAAYKRPRRIFFVESVERNISGKIDRARAKQRAEELISRVESRD